MLYPAKLLDNEFIKIHMSKVDKDGKKIEFDRWAHNFDEYVEIVKKYRNNWNVYNELATVKRNPNESKMNGKESNLFRRQVLYIDFDKKDYPHLGDDVYKFSKLIKDKLPDVFIHAFYNSGGGFHFYISVKRTKHQRDITNLNKDIVNLVGADSNACKVTQIARIPTTFNRKLQYQTDNKKFPLVIEIDHYQNHPRQIANFHPLDLDNLKRTVRNAKKQFTTEDLKELPFREWQYDNGGLDIKQYGCLCTEKVFHEGADEHERNTWLGRIIVWLTRERYPDYKIVEKCQEWNTRCRPPKSIDATQKEIDGWYKWFEEHGMSKIGGCWWSIDDDPRVRNIVCKQCDKFFCKQALDNYASLSISEDIGVKMNQKVLTDGKLSSKGKNTMSGYEYLILTILDKYMPKTGRIPFTVKNLKYRMQWKKSGKWQLCMDISTLKRTLEDLEKHKCIKLSDPTATQCKKKNPSYDDKVIKLTRGLKDMETKGYVEFYYSVARAFICHQITQNEYKVYLCILNNLKNHNSCTLEKMNIILNMGENNILRAIQSLEKASLLRVDHVFSNEKGKKHNMYYPIDTDMWNNDTDIDLDENAVEWRIKLIA